MRGGCRVRSSASGRESASGVGSSTSLPQPSTVHWHGIRIDNAMDGVPELTQAAVPSGGSFLYDFVASDAGTYWYHSHNRTWV